VFSNKGLSPLKPILLKAEKVKSYFSARRAKLFWLVTNFQVYVTLEKKTIDKNNASCSIDKTCVFSFFYIFFKGLLYGIMIT